MLLTIEFECKKETTKFEIKFLKGLQLNKIKNYKNYFLCFKNSFLTEKFFFYQLWVQHGILETSTICVIMNGIMCW